MTYSYAQKDNGRHLYGRRTAAAHTEARHGMDRRRGDTLVQQVGHQLAADSILCHRRQSHWHTEPQPRLRKTKGYCHSFGHIAQAQ